MNSQSPRPQVVIVDDDELTLEYLERVLERFDLTALAFNNGFEAISYLLERPARVLLMDARMPRIEGIEVLERLSDAHSLDTTRTFLCSSARPPEEVCTRAAALGASVVLKDVFLDEGHFRRMVS